MPGRKRSIGFVAKALLLFGGGWVLIITAYAAVVQFNLGDVAQGQMPLGVALRLGLDSLPTLLFLLIVGLVPILLVLLKKKSTYLTSLGCMLIASIQLYGVYLARFSLGLLLLPSTVIILIGAIILIVINPR